MDAEAIRQAAAAQFTRDRGDLLPIPVPEWGADCVIHYRKKLTIGAWEKIAPHMVSNFITAGLYAFVIGALDDDGKRLFSLAAVDEIRDGSLKLDMDVISRVVNVMGYLKVGEDEPSVEEVVKKHSPPVD